MKIRVVWVGKTRGTLAASLEDFSGRIRHFVGLDLVTLKESRTGNDRARIEDEEAKILRAIGPSDFVIGLDPAGRSYDSEGFAQFLARHMREDPRNLAFLVGGPAGLSDAVRSRADLLWSLSPLTVSHDLARLLLLEQIYRALTIIRNLPYAR